MAVSYVWFWAKPSYSQRLNMTMPLRNGNASDTAVTFDLNASMTYQSRGGMLRTDGHPEAVVSLLISGIAGWNTSTHEYGSSSYASTFSGTFPAGGDGTLVFELTHATEWPGFASYDQGVWEGVRFSLGSMRIR
jgi:hypothetical protein